MHMHMYMYVSLSLSIYISIPHRYIVRSRASGPPWLAEARATRPRSLEVLVILQTLNSTNNL